MIRPDISDVLPPVLAGPILRHLEPNRLVLWLVGSTPLSLTLLLEPAGEPIRRVALDASYGHPFSRRIVGNALLAYMLCQGWGNRPEVFSALLDEMDALSATVDDHDRLDAVAQDGLSGYAGGAAAVPPLVGRNLLIIPLIPIGNGECR